MIYAEQALHRATLDSPSDSDKLPPQRGASFDDDYAAEGETMTQALLEQLQDARHFWPPGVFRRIHEAAELPDVGEHVRWWSLRDVANWHLPDGWRGASDAVPFAESTNGELWCWYPGWASGNATPIVRVEAIGENARLYAPNFEGFLFRALLDQLSGADGDCDELELQRRARAAVDTLRPYLRSGWLALFGAITERLPHRNERTGQLQFLEPEEAREIAQRELPFEDLNPGLLQVS